MLNPFTAEALRAVEKLDLQRSLLEELVALPHPDDPNFEAAPFMRRLRQLPRHEQDMVSDLMEWLILNVYVGGRGREDN